MSNKIINTLSIIGSGVMGIEIAIRASLYGTNVRLYDLKPEALAHAEKEIKVQLSEIYKSGLYQGLKEGAQNRLAFFDSLAGAVESADLVIEAVPERLELKQETFTKLEKLVRPDTIIASNSSSIPISRIEPAVQHKERVANIHFYAPVMKNYFVDLLKGSATSDEVFGSITSWVRSLKCIPMIIKKECMGFIFNRLLHSMQHESLALWANGHADFQDVDRATMIWSGLAAGPFGSMDWVGLDLVRDIEMEYYRETGDSKFLVTADALIPMIERGDLGLKSGKGFYNWSNPEFARPDFLKA
jgi:3-hydroxybutyryl-CoA dehydrogenase